MEMVSKLAVLLVFFFTLKLSSVSCYTRPETHPESRTHTLARIKHFCNTPYLSVDTHSYVHVYAHELFYLREQCVPNSPKSSLNYSIHNFNRFIHKGNSVQATGLSPNPEN